MSCLFVLRVVVVALNLIALVMGVVSLFVPYYTGSFFTASDRALITTVKGGTLAESDPDMEAYKTLLTTPEKGTMDLWKVKYEYFENAYPDKTFNVPAGFLSCSKGSLNIQAAEGVGVVVCVLCCANLIMSIFAFFFSPVVKFPLALYEFLAAAASITVMGLTLSFYLSGWCGQPPLKEMWKLGGGFALCVISCVMSLASSVMTIFVY